MEERQDNKGEKDLAALFGLDRTTSRMSEEDAFDQNGNPFQLKTTSKTGGAYSTVRDFGIETIAKFRRMYFLFGSGAVTTNGFTLNPHDIWFMAPCHLAGWVRKLENHFVTDILPLTTEMANRCKDLGPKVQQILNNGSRLNDPNISKTYIRENGILISTDHKSFLSRLVEQFPLEMVMPTVTLVYSDIFQ
jgi:hypothetical protein